MSSPEPLCGALAGFILVRFLVFWIIANRFPNYRTAWTLRPEYSGTFEIAKKWTMSIRNWGKVRGELEIMYPDRLMM